MGLYELIGTRQIIPLLSASAKKPPVASATPAGSHSLEEMIEVLATRLSQQPDDVQGWALLARSYESTKRFPEAAEAYANALKLNSDNPVLMADYADALVMANGGRFTDQAGALLERAVKIQPGNIKALWLIGHWKNQESAYAEAVGYWEQAAALLPADSQDAKVIAQQISQARQQLGGSDEAETTTVSSSTPASAEAEPEAAPAAAETPSAAGSITVTVSLDPELGAGTSPDDTVFIFARATQGPRMPIAIVRKQVRDLPVTVALDDSQAMSPAMVLSKFDQVTVGARISKSGNAMPQSGDLQGSVSPVPTKDTGTIELIINSSVP